MSLNTTRTRRTAEGTTTGKRGRPESLVRQFWSDIDVDGVGPKCIFCNHRSVTRLFRAPPATRHTLICKNAPEEVKAQLRRVTNNKYSRRPPLQTDSTAAAAATKALPHTQQQPLSQVQTPQHQPQHPHQSQHHPQPQPPPQQPQQQPPVHQPPPHQQHHQQPSHIQQHSQPQPKFEAQPHTQQQSQPPPQPPQPHQPQFSFKHSAPSDPSAQHQDTTPIPNLSSPRHISGNVVTNMASSSPTPMAAPVDASVVPPTVRSAMLNDHRTVAAAASVGASRSMALNSGLPQGVSTGAGLSPGAPVPELLYGGGGGQRLSLGAGAEDLASSGVMERANAALTAAVIEALFSNSTGRKKDGPVPTPAEFRAALQEVKEAARVKAKRQRNEARAEVTRLQNAISLLVASKNMPGGHGRQVDSVDSDDSEDELGVHVSGQVGAARKAEWANGYDRQHK